ncbi:methionine ABC transporter ATP-binding protein [Nocardioides abyssi]|uniref:Methionine ABC transporter ATP-binding protein n=1 Tax=Nocardioides abyssi TaxID=3058370 RepID=A0ABT8ETI0_9ACTN|nr:methionine ABC transporter ATP-binding protein [Nocardioides abyssi]MDN4161482.1 methionine ABC transporter ATP-binding protein [Nocardioides abyssi]
MPTTPRAPAPGDPLIRLADVSRVFPARSRQGSPVTALDHVDLDVRAGEVLGVVGYSGAGKSTLLRLVNALDRPTAGTVTVAGREVSSLSERALREVRRDIGMIFQQFNLFASRTVWGNIAYPLTVAGVPKDQHRERISELLHFVGLADKAHTHIEQLSGGQKQRVGIARALATDPRILLADEPTSALDPQTTGEVLALLRRVNEELGITIVLITHEMEVVRTLADRVAVMEAGRVVELGDTYDVFAAPQHPATQRFVSTLVEKGPPPRALQRLRERHDGRMVTLSFRDGDATPADVFGAFIERGVTFELVHGGVEDVGGRTFGHLTFSLTGDDAAVADATAYVATLVELTTPASPREAS